MHTLADLQSASPYGAVQRRRPKFMAMATTFLGLVPIMLSLSTGADVMKRIAAPMIGGILTSFLLELLVYPGIYQVWKWNFEMKVPKARSSEPALTWVNQGAAKSVLDALLPGIDWLLKVRLCIAAQGVRLVQFHELGWTSHASPSLFSHVDGIGASFGQSLR